MTDSWVGAEARDENSLEVEDSGIDEYKGGERKG